MGTLNNVTVLLVEDNEVDVMGVKRAFKNFNLTNPIVAAENGYDALRCLRDGTVQKPYLLLLDLNMPKMNGIELLEELRKDPELKQSIVFVLTTSNAPEDKLQAYDKNIAGYIVKGKEACFVNAASLLEHYTKVCELP
jgi:CheY-like chemotaxis protein